MLNVILLIIFAAVPAIVLHEVAHGYAAYLLGDKTAQRAGRLTLNPIKHMDLWGSVLIPGALFLAYQLKLTPSLMLFGWAKPVPVNFRELKPLRPGIFLVAIAGVTVNVILAWILIQLYKMPALEHWSYIFGWGILLNLTLAVFNMVPIPPLDGSRVVTAFLPAPLAAQYNRLEPYGMFILIILMQLGFMRFLFPVVSALAAFLGIEI